MRMQMILLVLLSSFWAYSEASKLTVFVPDSNPIPFSDDKILSMPLILVFRDKNTENYLKVIVTTTGLNGPDIRGDSRYKHVTAFLNNNIDKHAIYVYPNKFFNQNLFRSPFLSGDKVVLSSSFQLGIYALGVPPILFISDVEDFKKYNFLKMTQVGDFRRDADQFKRI